jgi:hypothetical protein
MKKSVISVIILLIILWMIVPVFAVDITEVWNATYDGGDGYDAAQSVEVDSSGNVYVTGASYLSGYYDYYTIKYNSTGDEQWAVNYDGGNSDNGEGVAVDSSGNVYVTGYSRVGDRDYYTIKYNSTGDEQWAVNYDVGGGQDDYAYGVAADDSYVYVTGGSKIIGVDWDYYTIKYDPSGNEVWNTTYDGGNGHDYAYGIAADSSGNVYITGYIWNGASKGDAHTIKYDSSGNEVWNATYDGGDNDYGRTVAVDSSGNVYVTGYSTISGYNDYFTIKYDSSGNEVWNATYDGGDNDQGRAVAVDSSGNVYVTGYSRLGGDNDYFTIKYDSSGNHVWNISHDSGNGNDNAYGIAVDNSYVYVTGSLNNGADNDYYTIKYSQTSETASNIQGGLDDLNLSYSSEEIISLESLYDNATGSVSIGSETWYYSGDAMAGYSIGEGWEYAGNYYIKLGSGITTEAQGEDNQEGYVNVSITTTLAIEVIQEDVDFGEGAVTAGYANAELYTNQDGAATQVNGNWTLPNAYAIEVRNVGNINCSLDIASSKTASSFIGGTNPEYQWKVSDKESGSCSGGLTHSVWYDVNSSARLCQHLSPINATDEIFLDIRVVVPYDANPSDSLVHKTDIITITASATA